MRILYLSQYFPPEVGATQTRAYEMGCRLAQAGHHVTMIAEIPNHPSGIIPPPYRGKVYERVCWNGMEVIRVWVKASPLKTFRNRIAFYTSYMVTSILAGLLLARGNYDVVYATSPPLFVGGAGLILGFLRHIPFIFEVRDLWPESAVAMGELHHPLAISWATRLEEAAYRRARHIVVVTNGIRRRLLQRGFPAEKLTLIPNGANVEVFSPRPEERTKLRRALGLHEKFIVLYAGILGIAQGMECLVESARLLRQEKDVHFLFVGEGPKKEETVALKERLGLGNMSFIGERPQSEMPGFFSAADVALVPLRSLELFRGALPSKMFEAWACECPIILSIHGEARDVLEKAQAGVFAEPEDAADIAMAILRLKNDSETRHTMGRNGRMFMAGHYSRKQAALALEQLLNKTIG